MEQTYDSVGQKKDVIVIDDSESPGRIPKKRTRAQAAAELAMVNGHSTNGNSSLTSSTKKRKVDEVSDGGSGQKAKGKASGVRFAVGEIALIRRLLHPHLRRRRRYNRNK